VIFFNQSDGVVVGIDDDNEERESVWHTSDGGDTWAAAVPQAG